MPQKIPPSKPHPELDKLIEMAKKRPPMTAEEIDAQRRSFVRGQLMLSNPNMTAEEADALIDDAIQKGY